MHYHYSLFPAYEKLETPGVQAAEFDTSISIVMLRLNRVKILDVHEGFMDKKGEIYFVSSITDGVSDTPIKVREEVPWENVKPGDFLDILPPGIVLYQSLPGQLPRFLDWRFLVMDSDAGTRRHGQLLEQLGSNESFQGLQDGVLAVLAGANPLLTAAIGLADEAFKLIGWILKQNQDDFIGKGAVTFTQVFDNFGVPPGEKLKVYPEGDNRIKVGDFEFQFTIELA